MYIFLELLRWLIIAAGIAAIVFLTRLVVRRSRDLSAKIKEYHKEQERNPQDPYQALAELLAEQRSERGKKRG